MSCVSFGILAITWATGVRLTRATPIRKALDGAHDMQIADFWKARRRGGEDLHAAARLRKTRIARSNFKQNGRLRFILLFCSIMCLFKGFLGFEIDNSYTIKHIEFTATLGDWRIQKSRRKKKIVAEGRSRFIMQLLGV